MTALVGTASCTARGTVRAGAHTSMHSSGPCRSTPRERRCTTSRSRSRRSASARSSPSTRSSSIAWWAPPNSRAHAVELIEAIESRWDGELRTWVDDGPLTATGSGRARTSDALLAVLVTGRADRVESVAADLTDPGAFGAPFGPTGVHRSEPTWDPDTYWRGPAWPQISYLLWLALRRSGHAAAGELGTALRAGAITSGFAEYWNPESGQGRGATPQSWSTLALLVDEAERRPLAPVDNVTR